MLVTSCPNCGATLSFRSTSLAIKVCDYCRTAVTRDGPTLAAVGKVAEVPDDVSPLQLGCAGRDGTHRFELVGRVRWRWSDGAWNEWLALFDDGSTGWLSDAMGRFMLLRETPAPEHDQVVAMIAAGRPPIVGTEARIGDHAYTVSDVRDVTCVASEGELPFAALTGTRALSVDLMAADGACASVQREGKDAVAAYVGRYVSLADVAATNLRSFEGWPMPRYAA